MISLHKTHLLFVEPKNAPTEQPVEDELTQKVDYIFSQLKPANCWRGHHDTGFGISSDNVDYIHKKYPIISNSLAPYYVRHHRKDIPQELIDNINEIQKILLTDNNDEYWEKIAEKDIYYFKTWQLKNGNQISYGDDQTTLLKISGKKEDVVTMILDKFYKELTEQEFEKEVKLGREICAGKFPHFKLCEIYVLPKEM